MLLHQRYKAAVHLLKQSAMNNVISRPLILVGLIVCLQFNLSYCQTSSISKEVTLKIVDGKTGQVIEFATIAIDKQKFFAANGTGEISLKTSDIVTADSVRISSVGYLSKSLKVNASSGLPGSIALEPNDKILNAVNITATKYSIVTLVNKRIAIMQGLLTVFNAKYALFIANSDQLKGSIDELEINVTNRANAIESPFRINICSISPDGSYPGEELINDDIIIYNSTRKRNLNIDLRKYAVDIPKNGFFIVVTILKPEYYKAGVGAISFGQENPQTPSFLMTLTNAKEDSFSMFTDNIHAWHKFENGNFRFTATIAAIKK